MTLMTIFTGLFFICLAFLAYFRFVYPFLIRKLAIRKNTELVRSKTTSNIDISDISAIIPTLNEADNISDKIDNLRNQGMKQEQILVVDSQSQDKTVSIAKDKGVKVLEIDEKGKLRALNRGLDQISNNIVVLTDADAFLTDNSLENALKYLNLKQKEGQRSKPIKAISAQACNRRGGNWVHQGKSAYQRWDSGLRTKESLLDCCCSLDGKFILLDKSALTNERLEPDAFEDDFTLTLQLRRQGFRCIVAPDCFIKENNVESALDDLKLIARRTKLSIMTILRHHNLLFNSKLGYYGRLILPSRRGLNLLLPVYLTYVLAYLAVIYPLIFLSASFLVAATSLISKRVNLLYNLLITAAILLAWLELLYKKPKPGGIWKKDI